MKVCGPPRVPQSVFSLSWTSDPPKQTSGWRRPNLEQKMSQKSSEKQQKEQPQVVEPPSPAASSRVNLQKVHSVLQPALKQQPRRRGSSPGLHRGTGSPPRSRRGPGLHVGATGGGPDPGAPLRRRGPGPGLEGGSPGGLVPGRRLGVGGGSRTARGTAGNESRVTPPSSSSAKIDPPPGNTAAPAPALSASATWIKSSCWRLPKLMLLLCVPKLGCPSLPA